MEDIGLLEDVLWNQLGSKEDYYSEVGKKPLGEFVREIVGLDMKAAKEAFSKYQDEREMNSSQIYFVNQIIEYIVMNGLMKDKSVLQESPFTDKGTVYELFGDDLQLWAGIDHTINQINDNAIRYDWEKLKDSNKINYNLRCYASQVFKIELIYKNTIQICANR